MVGPQPGTPEAPVLPAVVAMPDPPAAQPVTTDTAPAVTPAGGDGGDPFAVFDETPAGETPPPDGVAEDFSEFEEQSTADNGLSTGDKVTAVGQSLAGAIVEGTPTATGIVRGAKTGASIGARGYVFGPVTGTITTVLGAIGGGVTGWYLGSFIGKEAKEILSKVDVNGVPLTRESLEEYSDEERPYAVAGSVFGESMTFAGGFYSLARTGYRTEGRHMVGRLVNGMFDKAKSKPGTFLSVEAALAGSSSVAAGMSESALPGNVPARTTAEIAGGMTNIPRLTTLAAGKAVTIYRGAAKTLSQAGRETAAANIIADILRDHGENPEVVAKLLDDAGLSGAGDLSSASATGSKALSALERRMAQIDSAFGQNVGAQYKTNLDNLKIMIHALRQEAGNPDALKAAAAIEQIRFKLVIDTRVQRAMDELEATVSKITNDTPANRAEVGIKAKELLSQALADINEVGNEMWSAVPPNIVSDGIIVTQALRKIQIDDLQPWEKLPKDAADMLSWLSNPKNTEALTTGMLKKLRTSMRELGQKARAADDYNDARIYSKIENAVLAQLDESMGDNPAYKNAREFSAMKADKFNKTFAGDALAKSGDGSDQIMPEVLLNRAFAGGEAGAVRFKELEEATRFADELFPLDADELVEMTGPMLAAQERYLRLVLAEAIDPSTGNINAKRLAGLLNKNETLVNRFPDVRKDVEAALKSDEALSALVAKQNGQTKIVMDKAAFGKLAKFEDPVQGVRAVVNGSNPQQHLARMAKMASKTPEAAGGMVSAVIENAMNRATSGADGNFSFPRFRQSLFGELEIDGKSAIEVMREAGIIDESSVAALQKILSQADKVLTAKNAAIPTNLASIEEADALTDAATRIIGAGAANRVARAIGSSANSLIIGAGGSRLSRNMMDKVPNAKVRTILLDAVQNPEFMAMLVKKGKTTKEKARNLRQLHAYMWQTGYFANEDSMEEVE